MWSAIALSLTLLQLKEHKTDTQKLPEFDNELLPSLEQYLSVAKEKKMIAVFDVREPNVAHPYHGQYLNRSLKAILKSGIKQSKVPAHTHADMQ